MCKSSKSTGVLIQVETASSARQSPTAFAFWLFIMIVMATSPRIARAEATATFIEGQTIEVREGDAWSPARIIKKEGRRYFVHYDNSDVSNDEWITTERIRAVAGPAPTATTGTAGAPTGAAGPGAPPIISKPAVHFALGEPVEFKSWWDWKPGVVVNTRGRWYFIQHQGRRNEREWVEPWRLRKMGSTEDAIGNCDTYGTVRPGQGPPREDPGDPPDPKEWTHDALKRREKEKAILATPLTSCDRSAMAQVQLGADPGTPFKPDPEPRPVKPPAQHIVPLSGGVRNFFGDDLFVTSPQTGILAVTHYFDDNRPGLERIDVVAGRSLNTVLLPTDTQNLDVSPDGKLLAARLNGLGEGSNERFTIWNVEGAEARPVISFAPYDQLDSFHRDVRWVRFIDNEHIITSNSQTLVLWDLKAKAIWSAAGTHSDLITLSPGRQQIVMLTRPTITVIDAMSGQILRVIDASSVLHGGKICFKPDGAQVALSSDDLLVVYDMVSGRLACEFNPSLNGGETLAWVADRYILAGGTNLLGLDEQMLIWLYGKHPPVENDAQAAPINVRRRRMSMGGEVHGISWQGRYWYATSAQSGGGERTVLTSVVLPDDHVRAALANKTTLTGQMGVHPGVAVSLEVNLPDNIKGKVSKALLANLLLNGLTVSDGQPVKLVASCDSGKSEEMVYAKGMFFMPFMQAPADAVHMTVTAMIDRLAFVDSDGHTMWERKASILPPGRLQLKKDQSIEDAVNEAMQPTPFFFTRTMIPKLVPKASQTYGFGVSQLTAQGVVAGE